LPSASILITVSVSGTCLSKTTTSTLFSFLRLIHQRPARPDFLL
jgi:hypothetical protein